MARQNRCEIFDPEEIGVFHCIHRAVRRAMLCGEDRFSGQSYEQQAARPRPHSNGTRASDKGFLPMMLADYLKLVDWTGRQIVNGKKGRIPEKCKPILERLGWEREVWCDLVKDFGRLFGRVAGRPQSLADSAAAGGVSHRRSHGGAAMLASE